MIIISRILCLAIGYIFGLFQTGYIYGKAHNIDIREHGSGNAGTTNTLRTLGWKAGVITFLGDLFKAVLSVLVAWLIFKDIYPDMVKVLEMYAGLGAVLGHNFPFYLKFKGGKGIACTGGFILACFWQAIPISLGIFIVVVAITRYVSLGSILLVLSFLVQLVIFVETGLVSIAEVHVPEVYIIACVFTLLALWKHKDNIKRLLKGTENKFGMSKKEA